MAEKLELTFLPPPFNPREHARFRGKRIGELSREELLEALEQALRQIHSMIHS